MAHGIFRGTTRLDKRSASRATCAISILDQAFAKPMGIVADRNRLTIGGANTVWEYRKMPAVAKKLEPAGKHDACCLPPSAFMSPATTNPNDVKAQSSKQARFGF
jgi:hypothetical protein